MAFHDGITSSKAFEGSNSDSSVYSRTFNGFLDLDEPAHSETIIETVRESATSNFIVDFGDDAAYCAFDQNLASLTALFDATDSHTLNTRWLHLNYPFQQRDILELLARRYDFSPRLLALMCSDPKAAASVYTNSENSKPRQQRFWHRRRHRTSDSEAGNKRDELAEHSSISSTDSVSGGNLYKIVNNIWHYSSVDFGRSYICVGYNSLYGTKYSGDDKGDGLLPHCTRVWSWLLLCEDNTIISIHEDPFPFTRGKLSGLQLRILAETRRNLINVFKSLSLVDQDKLLAKNPMTVLPIRIRLGSTPEETAHRESDAPGMLFYYLFENWHNSYTLVTRKESRYGTELDKLRGEMFLKPKLAHIDRLDRIGVELGVLKRHYASYDRILARLLEPQQQTAASLQNSHVISEASQASLDTVRLLVTEKESMLGVSLSSPARVRFKRLRDMIDLYAVSEVEEYLKQKDSLVAMNFNLIAIKQSTDVERLTRVTLLLTKATILFLPISMMTAYFSVQLTDIEYSVAEYWISFAVIFSLSWVALFVFGVLSGSVQTAEVFRGVSEGSKRVWKICMHSRV